MIALLCFKKQKILNKDFNALVSESQNNANLYSIFCKLDHDYVWFLQRKKNTNKIMCCPNEGNLEVNECNPLNR